MEINEIIKRIDAISLSPKAIITQLKHEEDDEFYSVWLIESDDEKYLLKECKSTEKEIHLAILNEAKNVAPFVYQAITVEGKSYLLMEYIKGENLCKCNRENLILALDALIFLQQKTWDKEPCKIFAESFNKSLIGRRNRGEYLNDVLLEKAYNEFLKVYQSLPKTYCHDDLLPFNIVVSSERATLIDWEVGGVLPYPTSFARLIAHTEEDANALFYMAQADKQFAIDYYYDKLLKDKSIAYDDWLNTLEYFLFYEYCEWVFVGNKYNTTGGEYFKKYLPIAKKQAEKLLSK